MHPAQQQRNRGGKAAVHEILSSSRALFYLHPAASLARPGCGPIGDAKERAKAKTPGKHAVHVLPVDGERVPFGKGERATVRKGRQKTKPHTIPPSRLRHRLIELYIPLQADNPDSRELSAAAGASLGWKRPLDPILFLVTEGITLLKCKASQFPFRIPPRH